MNSDCRIKQMMIQRSYKRNEREQRFPVPTAAVYTPHHHHNGMENVKQRKERDKRTIQETNDQFLFETGS